MIQRTERDNNLSEIANRWKSGIHMGATQYEELSGQLGDKPIVATYKIDGELQGFSTNPPEISSRNGRVRTDFPALRELAALAGGRDIVGVAELYMVDDQGKAIPYPKAMSALRAPQPGDDERMRLAIIDVYLVDGKPLDGPYWDRWLVVNDLFSEGEYVHPVVARQGDASTVEQMWQEGVKPGNYEGVVMHTDGGVIKVKPLTSQDLAVIGIERSIKYPEKMGALLIAYMDADGNFRSAGKVGTGFSAADRNEWMAYALENKIREEGRVIFVKPTRVIEVISRDYNIRRAPTYNADMQPVEEEMSAVGREPAYDGIREDKTINPNDLRLEQVPGWKSAAAAGAWVKKASGIGLWLDDVRPMPAGFDVWAKTSAEAISAIEQGNVAKISFDHDLGGDDTGYLVAKFIEEGAFNGTIKPMEWAIHSANPSGANSIRLAMGSADRFWSSDKSAGSWVDTGLDKTAAYPKHPDTVIIKPNEYYPNGLDEKAIWSYYDANKEKLVHELAGAPVTIVTVTDHGPIVRRLDQKTKEPIRVDTAEQFDAINNGRNVEFHRAMGDMTDVAWVDIDPKELVEWPDVLDAAAKCRDAFVGWDGVTDVTVSFSGGRGFHIRGKLREPMPIDEMRKMVIDRMNEAVVPQLTNATTSINHNPQGMRLDVSTLHEAGSLRVPGSLNAKTGLVARDVSETGKDLGKLQKSDFAVPEGTMGSAPSDREGSLTSLPVRTSAEESQPGEGNDQDADPGSEKPAGESSDSPVPPEEVPSTPPPSVPSETPATSYETSRPALDPRITGHPVFVKDLEATRPYLEMLSQKLGMDILSPELLTEAYSRLHNPLHDLHEYVKKHGREDTPELRDLIERADVVKEYGHLISSVLRLGETVAMSRSPDLVVEWLNGVAKRTTGLGTKILRYSKNTFSFDPNSTENEGRWRIRDPQDFDQESFRRWTEWAGVKAPAGISFIVGDTPEGKAIQTIRFDKSQWDEAKAAQFWDSLRDKPGFERTWTWPRKASFGRVSYIVHMPGHNNSKGEAAPWVIKQHETGKILSSHSSEEEAKKHLQQIRYFKHAGSVGLCGFNSPALSHLYAGKKRGVSQLETYALNFGAVEIQSTHHKFPTTDLMKKWATATPSGFVFSLRAPKTVRPGSRQSAAIMSMFLRRASVLGRKLGPIVITVPRDQEYSSGDADTFLGSLPKHKYALLIESDAWDNGEVYAAAAERDIAIVEGGSIGMRSASWRYLRIDSGEFNKDAAEYLHAQSTDKDSIYAFINARFAANMSQEELEKILRLLNLDKDFSVAPQKGTIQDPITGPTNSANPVGFGDDRREYPGLDPYEVLDGEKEPRQNTYPDTEGVGLGKIDDKKDGEGAIDDVQKIQI